MVGNKFEAPHNGLGVGDKVTISGVSGTWVIKHLGNTALGEYVAAKKLDDAGNETSQFLPDVDPKDCTRA